MKRDRRIGDWSGAPSRVEARRDLPITELDRILADYDTRELEAGYPFRDPPQRLQLPPPKNEIERLARRHRAGEIDWLGAMEALLRIHRRQGRVDEAARVARLVAQAYPTDSRANFVAGVLLLRQKQPLRARRYLERSLHADPDAVPTLRALARLELALGNPRRAREHLARVRQLAPGEPPLRRPAGKPSSETQGPPAERPTGGP